MSQTEQEAFSTQCGIFYLQATEELSRGDLRQASEKAWGAASQIVKAVGEERGIAHDSHRGLYSVVRAFLADHDYEETVRHGFAVANELHRNFYEGYFDARDVESRVADVGRMIDRITELSNGTVGS